MEQKKKIWKGMLGIALCFALVFGLMPGMNLTAYATDPADGKSETTAYEIVSWSGLYAAMANNGEPRVGGESPTTPHLFQADRERHGYKR
ncbi:MAG: hypothetical protein K6E91_03795 [Butyrivibrio sp.]|nr:hypothetical protein [Butyrivibrio sp.]